MNVERNTSAVAERARAAVRSGGRAVMGPRALALFICLLLAAGEGRSASSQQAAPPRCGSLDVVMVIDDSGSLWDAIQDVKREAAALLDLIDNVSGGAFRLGLVTFRDAVDVDLDLDAAPSPKLKKAAMREAILRIRADHGTGDPEASDEALRTVLHALPAAGRRQVGDFRGRFVADTRIVILVTDELPGGFDDIFTPGVDDASAAAVAADAAALGVRISAIYVPTARFLVNGDPAVIEIMRNYAIATGGLYYKTRRNGQGTANALSDVIAACGRRPVAGAPPTEAPPEPIPAAPA